MTSTFLANQSHVTVQKNFVQVIRAVEFGLGIPIPGQADAVLSSGNLTAAINHASSSPIFNPEVQSVLKDSLPIINRLVVELGLDEVFKFSHTAEGQRLITRYGCRSSASSGCP